MKQRGFAYAICKHCGQDIEYHGRAVGWRDRGGNRDCCAYIENGEIVKPKTKHTPFEITGENL